MEKILHRTIAKTLVINAKQKASAKKRDEKNNQMRISQLTNIITKREKLNGWAEQQIEETEERISELEDRTIDTTPSEKQRQNRLKQTNKQIIEPQGHMVL